METSSPGKGAERSPSIVLFVLFLFLWTALRYLWISMCRPSRMRRPSHAMLSSLRLFGLCYTV
jgi:hypothetical protein